MLALGFEVVRKSSAARAALDLIGFKKAMSQRTRQKQQLA
ncbi:hypothetical protein PSN_0603 [Pseudomonas sp. NGC7]